MHPLNSEKYFGVHGLAVSYYNGTSTVNGYITKQVSANKFNVTDGSNPKERLIVAPTTAIATAINSSNQAYFTIPVYPFNTSATGATFIPHFAVDSATVVSSPSNFNVSDHLALPSGAGSLTVATLSGSQIATVTVGTAGDYTALFSSPTTCTRTAGSGSTFTAHYGIDQGTTVVATGGTLYAVGEDLALTAPAGAIIHVTSVDGITGAVTGFTVTSTGNVTALTANPLTVASGSVAGTAATFTAKWKLLSVGATAAGSGYNVGDTLIFGGLVATTAPTAHISVVNGSHQPTTIVVDSPGVGITTAATSITTSGTTATFNLRYHVLSIASSGGTGYAVNDQLEFPGMVATVIPTAHISVATSGAATTTVLDTPGSGISIAGMVAVSAATEHVVKIYDKELVTTEGNKYPWALGTPSVENSAFIPKYS